MDEHSYWELAYEDIPWEENRAYQKLASEASHVARQQQLPRDEFRNAILKLYDAYGDFLYATNPQQTESKDHAHWHNHFRHARLGKKLREPELTEDVLSGAAYKYLNGPMRVPMMDRALIDALIAQETFAYIDSHAGRGNFMTHLGCWGTWLAIVVAYQLLFSNEGVNWTRLFYGLAAVAALLFVIWAWPRKGVYALHRTMRDTYQLLTGSVVSVGELRRRVESARDKGVVWPAELYAVLDDVESRTKVL